jgi:hypothetical protein
MTHDYVGSIPQCCDYRPADLLSHCHLGRVGKQPITLIAQRQARVNHDLAILDLHHAAETTHSERFHAQDLNVHVIPANVF